MRHRGAILDGGDLEADSLQRANGGFPAGAWSFDADFDFAHAVGHGLAGGVLSDLLRGERSALARPVEANATGAGPAEDVPVHVGDVHLGVVESCENVGNAGADVPGPLGLDNLLGVRVFAEQFRSGGSASS